MSDRRCETCGEQFTAQHANHRYCSRACRRQPDQGPGLGQVVAATETAIAAARHLTEMDAGAVAALRVLAAKLDALATDQGESLEDLKAKFDNVTIPTYLKFCESLGLTPAGRTKLGEKKDAPSGKLGKLRSVPKPQTA